MIRYFLFVLSLFIFYACTDYLGEFQDEYEGLFLSDKESLSNEIFSSSSNKSSKHNKSSSSENLNLSRSSSSSIFFNDSDRVSPLFDYGVLVDERDGQTYKTIDIGSQTWMAENLNYKTDDSYCYNDSVEYCVKYGRLYTWNESVKVCPSGWHLPSNDEYGELISFVGGSEIAGKMLKSSSGWKKDNLGNGNNGVDAFFFDASPAGLRDNNGEYHAEGYNADFWSTTDLVDFIFDHDDVGIYPRENTYGFAVRCVENFGYCVPSKSSIKINIGELATWTFNWNDKYAKLPGISLAEYKWLYVDEDASIVADSGSKTSSVYYSDLGTKTAYVEISIPKHAKQTIQCEDIEVVGTPITDCKCTTATTLVDYTESSEVVWTVNGCKSSASLKYEWDGVVGTSKYAKSFTSAQNGFSPELRVSNSDDVVVLVKCPAVITTNGPAFLIDKEQKVDLPAGKSNLILDFPSKWNEDATGTLSLYCSSTDKAFSITVENQTTTESTYNNIQIETANDASIVVELSAAASCSVNWY